MIQHLILKSKKKSITMVILSRNINNEDNNIDRINKIVNKNIHYYKYKIKKIKL